MFGVIGALGSGDSSVGESGERAGRGQSPGGQEGLVGLSGHCR